MALAAPSADLFVRAGVRQGDQRLQRPVGGARFGAQGGRQHVQRQRFAALSQADSGTQAQLVVFAFQGATQRRSNARIVGVEQAIHHGQAQVVVTAVQRQQPRFQAAGGIESGQLFQGVAARLGIGGVDRALGQFGGAGVAGHGQGQQPIKGMTAQVGGIHVKARASGSSGSQRMQFGQRVQRRLPHQMMRIAQGLAQHRQHGFPADGGLRGQHREAGDAVAPHPLVIVGSLGDGRLANQAGISPERQPPQLGRSGLVLLLGGGRRPPPAKRNTVNRRWVAEPLGCCGLR